VADFTLEAEPRAITGKKVKQLRRAGIVPVVVYGPRISPVNLQIPYRPLQVALMKAGGTHLIDLKFDGKTQTVLTRYVQRDAIRGEITHVDFFAVDESSTIRTEVPVHLVGESPAVHMYKALLVTALNSIEIETLPSKLLSVIEVDISGLKEIGDSIHVSDLKLPEGVEIINDPEEMIVRATLSAAQESEEDTDSTVAEPEVIAKGKVEEDEE
jgi:large subunit ribosomal protein L25